MEPSGWTFQRGLLRGVAPSWAALARSGIVRGELEAAPALPAHWDASCKVEIFNFSRVFGGTRRQSLGPVAFWVRGVAFWVRGFLTTELRAKGSGLFRFSTFSRVSFSTRYSRGVTRFILGVGGAGIGDLVSFCIPNIAYLCLSFCPSSSILLDICPFYDYFHQTFGFSDPITFH